jgi:uncharacterized coiled-coil protein SlyX
MDCPCVVCFEGKNAVADKPSEESKGVSTSQETPEEKCPEIPNRPFRRMPAVAVSLSVSILVGAAAAIYAVQNFNISRLDFGSLAELLPHETASTQADNTIVTVLLTDIRSSQNQTEATLRENGSVLQQNTGALQQSAVAAEAMQRGVAAQQTDLKKISSQLSSLISRVDSLQNSVAPLTTSSIPQRSGRGRMARKKISRLPKPFGPVSVGGAPLSLAPTSVPVEERLPNG